jgi:hypothetical protein
MDAHWRRLLKIADADKSEWQRTVEDNREFAEDIKQLRLSFGLPVVGFMAFIAWLDNAKFGTEKRLGEEIKVLMKKHNIRAKWFIAIRDRVIGGDDFLIGPTFEGGFPGSRSWLDGENIKQELIIDENVALDNPIVQNYIKQMLDHSRSTPPQPQPTKNNLRKLDWTPVWEWWKRHPDVGVNELARMLGYDRSYMSRKLNEIEEAKSSHNSE